MEKVKLTDESWGELFPGEDFPVGNQSVKVFPLGVEAVDTAITRIQESLGELKTAGIDETNYSMPENILPISSLLLKKVPDLICLSTNLDEGDFKKLPLSVAVELTVAVVKVNIASKESLTKNLGALGDILTGVRGSLNQEGKVQPQK